MRNFHPSNKSQILNKQSTQKPHNQDTSQNNLKQPGCFVDFGANQLLKTKLKESFIHHKRRQIPKHNQDIQFQAEFQSGNLQFAAKISSNWTSNNIASLSITNFNNSNNDLKNQELTSQTIYSSICQKFDQYNLYLRNDTNTHGHQNWFYFRLKNNSKFSRKIKLNIVNLKRNLILVKEGQRIYIRTLNPFLSQWKPAGQNIQIKENKNSLLYKGRVRTLSFQLYIQPQTEYQISLLPPYTYSQMLSDIENIKGKQNIKVQILTYSLTGLAIPIITFTNPNFEQSGKDIILISSRIHPGQTVASYMVKGFINSLSQQGNTEIQEFLKTTIVKIIPMINPDGVVFGNFRTNFLGYDLNRSFHSDDQITNPEVCALKELGKKLKSLYGQKFTTFIDLHGHSSEKNIFTYGPDFENGHQKFYKARLLPKLLNSKSPYFNYGSCTFKLQEYKLNTARGFFLNTLDVPAFTIQSSYAIYETEDGNNKILTPKQWISFGNTLCQSFELIQRLNKTQSIKNRTQLKRAISLTEDQSFQLMNAIKKQIKKQETVKKIKQIPPLDREDSDGQDQDEDLDPQERLDMQKKLVQNSIKNIVLPKVFKPSILYPTVTPKLFNIGQSHSGSYKILYTRRNRYQSIKMPANTYLHSLQGIDILKPKARNIRLQKKIEFC